MQFDASFFILVLGGFSTFFIAAVGAYLASSRYYGERLIVRSVGFLFDVFKIATIILCIGALFALASSGVVLTAAVSTVSVTAALSLTIFAVLYFIQSRFPQKKTSSMSTKQP